MVVIIKLKKRVASACIFGVIIGKLSYQKEYSLIILLIIDTNSEVNFYYNILFLGLIISLRVVNSKKFLLNPKKVV